MTQYTRLITPKLLRKRFFLKSSAYKQIDSFRQQAQNCLDGNDSRFVIVVGPCSIHNAETLYTYAERLSSYTSQWPHFFILLRAYFEKARTQNHWKGIVYDPNLSGSAHLEEGLCTTRKILTKLQDFNLPLACEFIDPFITAYFSDLITWGFIGARTSTSQLHRLLASHLPMPIGFKNTLDNDIELPVQGALVAQSEQECLYLSDNGDVTLKQTLGNPYTHIVLRGGTQGPNYDIDSLQKAWEYQRRRSLFTPLMVDCSHGNSRKQPEKQKEIALSLLQNRKNAPLVGCMLESYWQSGNQPFKVQEIAPDISLTDPCLSFEDTIVTLQEMHDLIQKPRHAIR